MLRSSNPISDLLPADALPVGLGCSRLGSINGASLAESRALLYRALDEGIRFFDTSTIYGQGDSERSLAAVLGRQDESVICSKVGKYFNWKKRVFLPFKATWRKVARHSRRTQRIISGVRADPLPTCWDPKFLLDSLDASLLRLNRPRVEVLMLHSPDAETLDRGDAIGALERAQLAGKVGLIGVSVDDVRAAEASLRDPRVGVIQVPLRPGETQFDLLVRDASAGGVAVIGREVLGGAAAIASASDPATYAHERIMSIVRRPDVALALVGTTKEAHLLAAATAARAAM